MKQKAAKRIVVCLILASFLACDTAGTKPSMDDVDFTDLAGMDEKSDLFSARMTLVGELVNDEPQMVEYTNDPEYRGFTIAAQQGDRIDARVTAMSEGADPFLWLLNESFEVVYKNDDADGTVSSRINSTIGRTGTYYLVLRDLYGADATFEVSVTGLSGTTEAVEDLETFNALTDGAKMRVLFPEYRGYEEIADYDLAPEFSALPLRIVDELEGEVRDRVLEVYRDFRNEGFNNGAEDVPEVEKILRDEQIWAIKLTNGGRSYGNWVSVIVLDAEGDEIGGWGFAD